MATQKGEHHEDDREHNYHRNCFRRCRQRRVRPLQRSEPGSAALAGNEKVLGSTSNDDYRQALPRTSNDEFRDALPLVDVVFPDIVIATP